MPYTENSNTRPMSTAFPSPLSSPISSYAPSRTTSASSGSGSSSSTPLTPQSPFPLAKDLEGKVSSVLRPTHLNICKYNLLTVNRHACNSQETISPDTILQHYMNVARRLTENRQSLAASLCPSPGLASANASPKKMETIEKPAPVQAQAPSQLVALDWPPPQWMSEESLTLDELPDSETWSLPEYQLTQEWFEQTIRDLKALEEEKRVGEEIKADMGADMDVDMEVSTMFSHVG